MVFRRILVLMMGCLGCADQTTEPNVNNNVESKSSVVDVSVTTTPRVRLSDGRYLAYRERGVPKNKCKYSIILVHGFGSSKEMSFMASDVNTNNSYLSLSLLNLFLSFDYSIRYSVSSIFCFWG